MTDVTGLILPLFGLILLGAITARLVRQPDAAMGWLSTFILYLALPALFYKLLSKTPVEKLASWDFIAANVSATFSIFLLVLAMAMILRRASLPDATIQGLAGAYGNIGYMGPALAILTFGEKAAVPVALIFCFENILHFTITPTLMAVSGEGKQSAGKLLASITRSIATHPLIIASALGVGAAVSGFSAPLAVEQLIDYLAQAAAPSALFAMGVTLGLSPMRRFPLELSYVVPAKLVAHPLVMYLFLSWAGDFEPVWVFTAMLMAALPTATNVFVLAQQYDHWVDRTSASILVTTMLSVFSVSFLLYAVTTGLIPPDLFPG